MKKQNTLFAFALLFSLWGLGQTAMAQKARKEVSRAQAKTLMLKQQKATPSDLKRFRDEPIPGGMARIILEAHDVWGDGFGYQMLLDADHTAYGNEIPLPTPLGSVEVQYAGGVSPQECVQATVCAGTGDLPPVQNLSASTEGQKVTLKWDAPTDRNIVLEENFDGGTLPVGWKTVDADGDGYTWMPEYLHGSFFGHNESIGLIGSASFYGMTILTPDNYLITPELDLPEGGKLIYWVCAQDMNYPAEHYGIYVSKSGNEVMNFSTLLFEETLSGEKKIEHNAVRDFRVQGAWCQREIQLPTETKYVAFRHFASTNQFWIVLDDIAITKEGEPSPDYTYTVYRDGMKIKEGLSVTMFEEDGVDVGSHEYCVEVQYENGASPKECVDITVSPQFNPVTGLTASQDGMDAVLRWTAPVVKKETVQLSESFDTGKMPEGWTTIDSDGDGHAWDPAFLFDFGGQGHNGSVGLISSASYIYYVGVLTPDNYLISPELNLINGGTLSFWVCAQDISHPAEHYAVYASTGGNATTDFTTILLEETIESKTIQSVRKSSEPRFQTPWKKKTVTLPAGTKYVAFRHFDCSDMYRLCLDDVEISCKEDEIPYTYTIYRNGTEIASVVTETTYRDMNLVPGTYTYGVKVVYPNGESSVEEATLTITSLSETVTTRPYTLAVHENQITVTCKGEVRIYDINGRLVATGIDVVKYTTQNGVYVIRIIVNGKTYVEKVIL